PGAFYFRGGAAHNLGRALADTGRLVAGVARVPAQMWPIDPTHFAPRVSVPAAHGPVAREFFMVVYIGACLSVCVALFNLLPFPRLDGGMLLVLALAGALGTDRARGLAPYALRGVLLLLFLGLAFANAADFM